MVVEIGRHTAEESDRTRVAARIDLKITGDEPAATWLALLTHPLKPERSFTVALTVILAAGRFECFDRASEGARIAQLLVEMHPLSTYQSVS